MAHTGTWKWDGAEISVVLSNFSQNWKNFKTHGAREKVIIIFEDNMPIYASSKRYFKTTVCFTLFLELDFSKIAKMFQNLKDFVG